MINDRSIAAVDASTFGPHFRKPLYGSYCFSRIPPTLPWLFTGQGQPALPPDVFGPHAPPFDHVVFCYIDAFGWQHVHRAVETSRFLRHAVDEGVLSKMTSMFPSTTAAHVTTIHTGQVPGTSGVYAWQYYEPSLGAMIEALPFSFVGQPREGLRLTGASPELIYPGPSIYGGLAELGVRSFVLHPAEIANSTCNRIYTAGATQKPYKSFAEALVTARNIVLHEKGPTYTHLYHDKIDSLGHIYGSESEQAAAEVEMVWQAFGRLVHAKMGQARRTLFLVTADHGHMYNGDQTLFVNRDVPDVVPLLQTDRMGRPLVPAGSRREFFLHVRPAYLAEVVGRLREAFAGRVEVHPTEQLIAQGFFGEGPPSERFLARVGNVALLPHAHQNVWWYDGADAAKMSSHGGLTPQEMEIPLFVAAYGA